MMSYVDVPVSNGRPERISLRVDRVTNCVLRTAAELERKTLSAFMLDAASRHAELVVKDHEQTIISRQEFVRILDELEREPQVLPGLLRLGQTVQKQDLALD